MKIPSQVRWASCMVLSALVLLIGSPVLGQSSESSTDSETDSATDSSPGPNARIHLPAYRGSAFTYRNVVSAVSFARGAEPTYNPYYAMEFSFLPRLWAGDVFFVGLGIYLSREFTKSDWTTYAQETVLNDVRTTLGFTNFYEIPVLQIDMSADLGVVAPTSKASRARTLALGLRPGFSLGRIFEVLDGLSVGYKLGLSINFFSSTTALQEESTIGCPPGLAGCGGPGETTLSTGLRNAPFGLSNSLSVRLAFNRFVSAGASFGVSHSFLYRSVPLPEEYASDWEPMPDTDVRYGMFSNLEVTVTPMPAFSVSLGADTATAQLQPNSSYQAPFFNRYTNIYLDLNLNIAGLVAQITSRGGRR